MDKCACGAPLDRLDRPAFAFQCQKCFEKWKHDLREKLASDHFSLGPDEDYE